MVMWDRHGSVWACLCKFRNALSIISNPFMGAPRPHQGRKRKRRNNKVEAIQERAAAEVGLIVHLYLEGHSFRKIAARLGRNRWYVSNVFYSPLGQREVARYKTSRESLAEQLNDNVLYAAQRALDEIIALASSAQSEAVRLKASECIVDKALEDGNTASGSDRPPVIGPPIY
jgi:hypothetical protein